MDVLVVNAGSTSLKLRLVRSDGQVESFESLEAAAGRADAVAHRVVHGGPGFREPVVIDDEVRRRIADLEALAPLHNRPALEAIAAAAAVFPAEPHVAVFDTGFHASIPEAAATYAIPAEWREQWGIRRYGFHGLSVQWSAEQVPVARLVVCHLGGGSSVTAVLDGRSVDTSMGFSPLDGVPMTTRAGSLDPGAILYAAREHGIDAQALDRTLNFDSGLKALAGGSGDMRELERRAADGDARAALALDVFVFRLVATVAAMAAATGGLDALVFTAGIGEGSALVRRRVCERLGFLGVELDERLNATCRGEGEIAADGSRVRVVVVRAREELVAARAAVQVLARRG